MNNLSGQKILIVDDNRALAENLGEILQGAGYEVGLAASCAEALAATDRFCVALVDVRLPDGDGTVLAGELKTRIPDSEVILLTGFGTMESAMAAVRAGAWAYLIKPCSIDNLLLAVSQAVRQVKQHEEKRQLARRALVAEKLAAVGTLAAGLSHEIRNPLNAASLQLILLERRLRRLAPEIQPPLLVPLGLVQHEIQRLSSILGDFLSFARPRELFPVPVDLRTVADEVLGLLAAQAEQAGLRLERELAEVRPIAGDTGLLKQALMNLVLNAIQATPTGGWVRVELGEKDAELVLAVEDSGPGIAADVSPRLFEPFFTTKESGSGLGLPLAHSIVQQHGGHISVEGGKLGGARFVIRLPPSGAS